MYDELEEDEVMGADTEEEETDDLDEDDVPLVLPGEEEEL